TPEHIRERQKKIAAIKKDNKTQVTYDVWNTISEYFPLMIRLFEGSCSVSVGEGGEHYGISPVYAKKEDGVLYVGLISEERRYKIFFSFEEDAAFKDGSRYKTHSGDEWIDDEE